MLALIVAGVGGGIALIEAITSPWAVSLTGSPTLTGEWSGAMIAPSGRRYAVWLEIRHPLPSGKCNNCPGIEGRLRTCDDAGIARDYRVWGDVEDWRGTRFHLRTLAQDERAGGPELRALSGAWSGETLELTGELRVPAAGESSSLPVVWRMAPGPGAMPRCPARAGTRRTSR